MRKDYCDCCGDEITGEVRNLAARTKDKKYDGDKDFFLDVDLCHPCADKGKQAILDFYHSLRKRAKEEVEK